MGYFRHGFLTYIVYGLLLLVYRDLSATSIHISWPTEVEGAITSLSHPIHYYRDKDRGVDPRGVGSLYTSLVDAQTLRFKMRRGTMHVYE